MTVISQSYGTAKVTGSRDSVGGLADYQLDGNISKSYAAGKVTGNARTSGGLLGLQKQGSINASYFDSGSTGQSKGVGVVGGTGTPTGYNTSDLTRTSVLQGWDFTNVWYWLGKGQWPILQWQHEMQQADSTP